MLKRQEHDFFVVVSILIFIFYKILFPSLALSFSPLESICTLKRANLFTSISIKLSTFHLRIQRIQASGGREQELELKQKHYKKEELSFFIPYSVFRVFIPYLKSKSLTSFRHWNVEREGFVFGCSRISIYPRKRHESK